MSDSEAFPIGTLSERTQVNTVTLRAWERRYGLLKPSRTPKGHRLYTSDDITRVEQIVALTARGVPLKRVKELLETPRSTPLNDSDDEWPLLREQLTHALQQLSTSAIEQQLHELLIHYPPRLCRQQLFEPLFEHLGRHTGQGGLAKLLESALIRYAIPRLKQTNTKGAPAILLLHAERTPLWSLALSAMELADAGYRVELPLVPFRLPEAIQIRERFQGALLFYQDGIWRDPEHALAEQLLTRDNSYLCGTAVALSSLQHPSRIFPDLLRACDQLLLLLREPR